MKMKLATLKSILESNPGEKNLFLSLIKQDGTITHANARFTKKLGLNPAQKGKANIFDFIHPLHVDEFRKAMEYSAAGTGPANTELCIKNGHYHPMKWQVNYLPENKLNGSYFCLAHKITGDKKIPELHPSSAGIISPGIKGDHEMFVGYMNQLPNLAWIIDEEGRLKVANHAFLQYFQLDKERSAGKMMQDIIPEKVVKALYEKHVQVLKSGTPLESHEKMKMADGNELQFKVKIFPVPGIDGKKLIGGYAASLAEKEAVEKRLEQINQRFLLLTRATSDAIWEWDMQTGYIFRNDVLMNMIGYNLDQPKGLSWWLRRIHPEDRNRVSDRVKESTERSLQSWQEEYRFKCADGVYKQMRDKGYIVYENGLPVKMIGSIQDVSDIRELEDQLIEQKLHKQRELSEAVIKAQELERTRIGYELHDNVNQILSTTKLFVDMLTPANKKELEIKKKSLDYIIMTIEEIRKLSKELVIPQLKDKGLIESMQSLIEEVHLSTRIKVKFVYDLDHEMVNSKVKLTLFRIVQEQIKNIIKHSKATKVEIVLQQKNNHTQLIIKDNGVGFDVHKIQQGIGLSSIFERTRFYDGDFDIQSSPGKGCVLSISIPELEN